MTEKKFQPTREELEAMSHLFDQMYFYARTHRGIMYNRFYRLLDSLATKVKNYLED